jgi:O-antigen/teichoic acid export membrane protein
VQPAAALVIFIVLAYLFPAHRTLAAVICYALANVVAGITAVVFVARVTRLRFHWSRELTRSAVTFGVQGYMADFLSFLNLHLDLLLVNLFLEPLYVGQYSIAVMVAEKMWYIPDALAVVLHPRVAHGSEEEANRDTAKISRQTILLVSLGCIVILLIGRFLVELLYLERFLPAVVPLFLLLPGILSASFARVVSSDLLARGYPRINMWAGLVALVSNVALNVVLIPRMGTGGAALATTVSYSMHALVLISVFIRITRITLGALLVPRMDDIHLLVRGIRKVLRRTETA